MKASAGQIRSALDSPKPAIRLYLLHGPDEAGAQELVQRLGRALGPDAERVDFTGASIRSDPARLVDEAAALSLFGGRRYVRVTGAGEDSVDAMETLLGAGAVANPVIVLAPGAKASGKLVKLAVASPAAMSFACYAPEGLDLERMVVALGAEQGLRIEGDLATQLIAGSGPDRATLAREIEKLALYLDAAPDRPRPLTAEALASVGADLAEPETARIVEAVIAGRGDQLGKQLATAEDAGGSPIPVLRALVRRLTALAEMRIACDNGGDPARVVEQYHVFFRERPATIRALRLWSPARLDRAILLARKAERDVMASASTGTLAAERALIDVARLAARRN